MEYNELYHHGVLGMRWGVRKSRPSSSTSSGKNKTSASDNSKKETTSKKKSTGSLSDDELRAKINRLTLEKQYKELSNTVHPQKSKRGKEFAIRVIEKIGENALVNIGSQAATKGLGLLVNKIAGTDPYDPQIRFVNPNKGQTDKK